MPSIPVATMVAADELESRDCLRTLITTPWMSSWLGDARSGDLSSGDLASRRSAWAQWAVANLATFSGVSQRSYPALVLPGRFYDPRGGVVDLRPHLEIGSHVLERPDSSFPDRLALAGNGLLFNWWLRDEVTAARRAVITSARGEVSELALALHRYRTGLVSAVQELSSRSLSLWPDVEAALVVDSSQMLAVACDGFDDQHVASVVPDLGALSLSVSFDSRLLERNGQWTARRIGVWHLKGADSQGKQFSAGVITPRLTSSSLFSDPLFDPESESPAALLVRYLVMSRVVAHLDSSSAELSAVHPDPVHGKGGPFLRAVVAQPGQAMPRPSTQGAMNFLNTFPDPQKAWVALNSWAEMGGYLLTITQDGFVRAHTSAMRFLRRAEDPDRSDIEVVLPLAWDSRNRVVRVTFSRGTE